MARLASLPPKKKDKKQKIENKFSIYNFLHDSKTKKNSWSQVSKNLISELVFLPYGKHEFDIKYLKKKLNIKRVKKFNRADEISFLKKRRKKKKKKKKPIKIF